MNNTSRRSFLTACAGATVVSGTAWGKGKQPFVWQQPQEADLAWHNPESWGVEGRAFDDTASYYDRLPARAEGVVRDAVWGLSRHSSGISFRFKTDSPEIHVRYELGSKRLAMPHMPATSVSGVDLYAKDELGDWRWVAAPKVTNTKLNLRLVSNLIPASNGLREFMMYLPLYNSVNQIEVGVQAGANFEGSAPRTQKPILFYGTSIMHGACASRSGMSISGIVGRKLNRPTINLGFSGNGKMELEVGRFLCELDPCVFAIDCLPNMNGQAVSERCVPLVHQLRSAKPNTPILLVEDRVNTSAWIRKGAEKHHASNRAALQAAYQELKNSGVGNLYYLGHQDLLGDDHEAATDGSHPSDLGMMRYAQAYENAISRITR